MTKIDLYEQDAFYPWLSTIARNLCLNYLKSKFAERRAVGMDQIESLTSDPEFEIRTRLAGQIYKVFEELPVCSDDYRQQWKADCAGIGAGGR